MSEWGELSLLKVTIPVAKGGVHGRQRVGDDTLGPNFIKLCNRKCYLTNFTARHKFAEDQPNPSIHIITYWLVTYTLLSINVLCQASLCAHLCRNCVLAGKSVC